MHGILKASSQPDLTGKFIDNGALKLIEVLGAGGYGVVYHGKVCNRDTALSGKNPDYYAVKCLQKETPSTPQTLEVKHHNQLSSMQNILTLHHDLQDDDFVYLALDLCTGGGLLKFLRESRFYPMEDAKTKSVVLQIIDALSARHNASISHGDIKL